MDKKTQAVLDKYSAPFVQLVLDQDQESPVFETLSQIKVVFEETGLNAYLGHIGVSQTDKEAALRRFQPTGSHLIDNLLEVVILNQREDLFLAIVEESLVRLEKLTNEFEVTLSSSQPLSEAQKERLRPLLEQKMGLKVRSFKEVVDPSLIGGFVITANHKTIDASIKRQLQAVKENLK